MPKIEAFHNEVILFFTNPILKALHLVPQVDY